jgi:hypothetical protein
MTDDTMTAVFTLRFLRRQRRRQQKQKQPPRTGLRIPSLLSHISRTNQNQKNPFLADGRFAVVETLGCQIAVDESQCKCIPLAIHQSIFGEWLDDWWCHEALYYSPSWTAPKICMPPQAESRIDRFRTPIAIDMYRVDVFPQFTAPLNILLNVQDVNGDT